MSQVAPDSDSASTPAMQPGAQLRSKKFRRISKACEHCRVRKKKCDGKCPCQQCIDNSRECIYNDHIPQRKPRSAVYIAKLEREVQRLRSLLPSSNTDNSFVDVLQQTPESLGTKSDDEYDDDQDQPLETMIATTAQLFIDARGKYRYQGHSAGFTLLGYVQDRINHILHGGSEHGSWIPFDVWKAFDQPSPHHSPMKPPQGFENLPNIEIARALTDIALDDACCLMSFVHRPTFSRLLNQVYSNRGKTRSPEEIEFLPLLYEALALGSLFTVERETDPGNKKAAEDRSLMYFETGRDLIDLMACNDIFTIQAIMFMVMFLQASGRLSACHSYLSVAIGSAMRLGLHSSTPLGQADAVRVETRKRIIWELYTMETYVTAMLGLPKLLNNEYIYQSLPSEVEVHANTGVDSTARATDVDIALVASNDHTTLILIMSKIISDIYPVLNSMPVTGGRYQVRYKQIVEIQNALAEWHKKLPTNLPSQSEEDDPRTKNQIRTQLRLRLAYAHVEMVLYRPFLHHLIPKGNDIASTTDFRSYACGSTCIKAAMQVIWLVEHMANQQMLTGTYWLTVYMTFFASIALLLFSVANQHDSTASDALATAEKGRRLLMSLAESSPTAAEAADSLTFLSRSIARVSGINLNDR